MSRWFTLKAPPVWHRQGDMLAINDHEILISPMSTSRPRGKGLFIYNTFTDEWKKWIKYPRRFELHEHSIALNNHNQRIYFVGTLWLNYWNQLIIANTSNEKVKNELADIQGNVGYDPDTSEEMVPGEFSAGSKIVNVNGTMHIIGGWNNTKHFVYDENARRLRLIHDFADSDGFVHLYGFSLVYVASKGLLFLIGGCGKDANDIHGMDNEHVRVYDVVYGVWTAIKGFKMSIYNASAALSYNEEYIVIAGGTKQSAYHSKHVNSISILDIRNEGDYKVRKSAVVCPKSGPCCIARCGGNPKNKLLVFGYLRREFLFSRLNGDVVQYIAMWYDQEMIHWIDNSGYCDPCHFGTSLREILWS